MKTNVSNTATTHETMQRPAMKSRFAAAVVSGCLALSLCPAIAFAAPGGNDAGQGSSGNPPAMQQDGQAPGGQAPGGQGAPSGQAPDGQAPGGQVPDMQGAPSGQAPSGGPAGGSDAFDDQVRSIISDEYGIDTTAPNANGNQANGTEGASQDGRPSNPQDAPDLPEGAINVQQIIDTLRDVFFGYSSEELSANIDDADFVEKLKEYAKTAMEQRFSLLMTGEKENGAAPDGNAPANGEMPQTADTAASDGSAPATPPADGQATPPADGQANQADAPANLGDVSSSLVSKIVSALSDMFGISASA